MKTYILHHNDPDGLGAAVAAYFKFGDNAKYIMVDYTMPMPELEDGSDVYILDFSYKRAVLDKLVARMNNVLIIDHHKSAQEDLKDHPNAIFDMNKSGAGLSWDYFVGGVRPDFINYIEDADLWRFAHPNSKLIKNYIYQLELDVKVFLEAHLNFNKEKAIEIGKIIEKSIEHDWEMVRPYVHTMEVNNYIALAVNSSLRFSEFGEYLLRMLETTNMKYDFTVVYYHIGARKVKFSLRSRRHLVDVSKVCTDFGGGGHARAGGFEIDVDDFNPGYIMSKRYKKFIEDNEDILINSYT